MKNTSLPPRDAESGTPHDYTYWMDDPTMRLRRDNRRESCLGTFEESLESIDRLLNKSKLIE